MSFLRLALAVPLGIADALHWRAERTVARVTAGVPVEHRNASRLVEALTVMFEHRDKPVDLVLADGTGHTAVTVDLRQDEPTPQGKRRPA